MPEPYRSEYDRYVGKYLTTGRAHGIGIGREMMGLRKDGSTFAMELAVGKSHSGGRPLFAGIVRDISERNKSEQELQRSEAKTRAILETAVDGIITIDPQGMILTANPATERIFGYRIDEMVGHKVNMLMPDPYRSAHDSYLERYLTTGERRIIGIGREVHGRAQGRLDLSHGAVGGRGHDRQCPHLHRHRARHHQTQTNRGGPARR